MTLEIYRDSCGTEPILLVNNDYGWFVFLCQSQLWARGYIHNSVTIEELPPGSWLSLLVLSGVSKGQAAGICIKDEGNWYTTEQVVSGDQVDE